MNTQDKIKIMQAYLDGAVIQRCRIQGNGFWTVASEPKWEWCTMDYRVKPEPEIPREVWIQFSCLGGIRVHDSRPMNGILGSPYSEPVRFREVLEDDQ